MRRAKTMKYKSVQEKEKGLDVVGTTATSMRAVGDQGPFMFSRRQHIASHYWLLSSLIILCFVTNINFSRMRFPKEVESPPCAAEIILGLVSSLHIWLVTTLHLSKSSRARCLLVDAEKGYLTCMLIKVFEHAGGFLLAGSVRQNTSPDQPARIGGSRNACIWEVLRCTTQDATRGFSPIKSSTFCSTRLG